jgi:phosphatidylserine/phosphatidylglycerophosphate/cardiolipin synthase-like enzyme
VQLLGGAAQRLELYIFELRDAAVERALIDAVRRGVAVRALVEPSPGGRVDQARAATDRLRRGGVQVRTASPAFRKTHAKALLVDATRAWIGSANFVDAWTTTRDFAVITRRPETVGALAAVFERDWASAGLAEAGTHQRSGARAAEPCPGAGSGLVVSPANGREAVTSLIRGARRSLQLEHSRLDDAHILAALAARSLAGVTVQVVLDRDAANRPARRFLRKRAPAAQVQLVKVPTVHAKVVIADGERMLLGSHNLTRESLDERREIGLLVEDAAAVARVAGVLRGDLRRSAGGGSA